MEHCSVVLVSRDILIYTRDIMSIICSKASTAELEGLTSQFLQKRVLFHLNCSCHLKETL